MIKGIEGRKYRIGDTLIFTYNGEELMIETLNLYNTWSLYDDRKILYQRYGNTN